MCLTDVHAFALPTPVAMPSGAVARNWPDRTAASYDTPRPRTTRMSQNMRGENSLLSVLFHVLYEYWVACRQHGAKAARKKRFGGESRLVSRGTLWAAFLANYSMPWGSAKASATIESKTYN
eukprot:1003207-Pleurochrysis_carterae.AAC.4